MKKVLSILLVLCVVGTLFAATGLTVKGGPAFDIFNQKTAKDDNEDHEYMKFKGNGFGFDLGVQYDLNNSLLVFGDFNMVFSKDAYIKFGNDEGEDNEWIKLSESLKTGALPVDKFNLKINFLDVSAGVAYKLDFSPVKLAVGAGFTFNRAAVKVVVDKEAEAFGAVEEIKIKVTNFGVTGYVDAKYMVAENIGVGVTLLPQLNLYNSFVQTAHKGGTAIDAAKQDMKGFAVGFAMPIVVGVSYSI